MPGFVTHYLFGVDAYKKIKTDSIRMNLKKNHSAYSLGLQGPDIFFFYLPSYLLHKQNIGDLAHRKDTGAFFSYLLESRILFDGKPKYLKIADAYITGFIGHYILDSIVHPYVYAFTKYNPDKAPKNSEYFGQHAYFETEIDNELLYLKKGLTPSNFRQDSVIRLSKMQKKVITKMLTYAYTNTYSNITVYNSHIKSAIHWMVMGTRLMHDPSGQKKVVVRFVEKVLFDRPFISAMMASDHHKFVLNCFNLNNKTWIHPWTKEKSNESFFDLYEKALSIYTKKIVSYYQLVHNGYKETERQAYTKAYGNRSFISGLTL